MLNREPPSAAEMSHRLAMRLARDGSRTVTETIPPLAPEVRARRDRCLRHCHRITDHKARHPKPHDSGAYVPEMSARLENDLNLTDGARRCARKLMEYVYRKNREGREAEVTVTWLMKALGKSRRTVQRYLRQLEREGYIAVDVLHARTRMCAGLIVALLSPLFPRHRREKWPQKLMKTDAPFMSQNYRPRYKTGRISRELWALRCADAIWRAWQKTMPPLPPFPSSTVADN